ncbi:SH3 domain-containing YSC84-like protein 1, partial [Rhizoclosmatium sp. JEL0117]
MGHDFPAECDRAAQILTTLKAHTNFGIPAAIMQGAKGVAIFHVTKAGMLFSIRSGTGLVLARLPDGSWSAPSAIKDTSLGMGHQLGVEVIDLVFVLNTDKAVEAFAKGHNFQVGADISFAVGPLGRNAEGQLNLKALSAVLTYSHSKGLYLGASVNLS